MGTGFARADGRTVMKTVRRKKRFIILNDL
jgi:hypothetical protein